MSRPGAGPLDLDVLKATLIARLDSLVMQLYPAAVRDGNHWRLGDVDGAPGQSLAITRTGAHAGQWTDFNPTGARASGDLLHLVAHVMTGGDFRGAVDWAREWCGLGAISPEDQRRLRERAQAATARHEADAERLRADKRARAQRLFFGAPAEFRGTPGAAYLAGRCIDLARLRHYPRALRFHAAVTCGEVGAALPAMLACVTDAAAPVNRAFLATHRTWLAPRADGTVTKAQLKDAKKSLGSIRGGTIPLSRGHSGAPLKEGPHGEWVTLGEGIETCLSFAIANPDRRVLACVALGNLGCVSLPPHVGGIIVLADNDPTRAGLDRQLALLTERGLPHVVSRPPERFKDFNDWLQALVKGVAA